MSYENDVESATKLESASRNWLGELVRLRFQYMSALLIAIVLPVTLRWGGEIDGWFLPVQFNTAVASSLAMLVGMLSLRQIGSLPGAREGYYLLPVMLASFAAVLLVMLFARIEYNRYLFPTSLVLTIVWLFLLQSITSSSRVPLFAVLPDGRAGELTGLAGA